MTDDKDKKKKHRHEAPYLTYALAEEDRRDGLNVSRPSDENVIRAKEWVDENEK